MKNYELIAFLAKQPADAEIEIWGPYFSEAALIPANINPAEPSLEYSGGSRNTVTISVAGVVMDENTQNELEGSAK